MKNLKQFVLATFIVLIAVTAKGQKQFTTYQNTITKELYNIQLSFDKKGNFSIWFDAYSSDKLIKKVGFYVKEKEYPLFIDNLLAAKSKYIEWVATANENNVTELKKEMAINTQPVTGYFYFGSDWHFIYNIKPTYNFSISEMNNEIEYLLLIRSGKLIASDNQYMDCNSFYLIFNSAEEISRLVEAISLSNIEKFKNNTGEKDDLFK